MPEEFWILARWLIEQSAVQRVSPETHRRAGIGRAYYAAYHQCRRFLNLTPEQNVSHKRLQNLLHARGGEFATWADRLRILYALREKADYRLHSPITGGEANESLHLGRAILDRMEVS